MHNHTQISAYIHKLNKPHTLFIIMWLLGLSLGTFTAAFVDDSVIYLMRPTLSGRVSFFRHFAAMCLPFLFAAYAVAIEKTWLLWILGLVKAFGFSFCGYYLCYAYGSAGWLVRLLYLFTDICTVPVLIWFCLRHTDAPKPSAKRDVAICIALVLIAVSLDFFVISPFWADLLN